MDFTGDIFQVTVPLFNIGMLFNQSTLKRDNVCKEMLDKGVIFLYYANSQCMRYHLQMFSSVLGKNYVIKARRRAFHVFNKKKIKKMKKMSQK